MKSEIQNPKSNLLYIHSIDLTKIVYRISDINLANF